MCQLTGKVDYHAIFEAQGVHNNISETKIQSHRGVSTASLSSKQGSRDRKSRTCVEEIQLSCEGAWCNANDTGTHGLGPGYLCLCQRKNKMGLRLTVT